MSLSGQNGQFTNGDRPASNPELSRDSGPQRTTEQKRFQATVENDYRSASQVTLPLSTNSVASVDQDTRPEEASFVGPSSHLSSRSKPRLESSIERASLESGRETSSDLERLRLAHELQQERKARAAKEE
jgi:hypothetical protein